MSIKRFCVITLLFSTTLFAKDGLLPPSQRNNHWFTDAEANIAQKAEIAPLIKAKNVILFVGDGMSLGTVTAARILDGQNKGLDGEENSLSFESFPYTGLSKTYNVNAQTPDSAGTMTAMMTGVKTDAGVVGVDEDVRRGVCKTAKGNELVTALELAELNGKSTGFVTTTRVTHATPAATFAISPERNWEDISDMPKEAIEDGCEDIASQLVYFEANMKQRFHGMGEVDGIDVVMGGGRRHFLPNEESANSSDAVSEIEGDRTDNRNLIAEWQGLYPSGRFIIDQAGFDGIEPEKTNKLLALFNESHMHYEADRHNDISGEPSLSQMTAKAIDILDNNQAGFFLMVEGGRIDHAHHAGNAFNALNDTIELSRAVEAALDKTSRNDTLIIVTADHGHVLTMAGYPKRGNPILGKVVNVGENHPAIAMDGKPFTTLNYVNGLGYRDLRQETDADERYSSVHNVGRHDLTDVNTELPGFHQEALVPLDAETHSGEDVTIYGIGPGAGFVSGVNEQNIIFHIMMHATGLIADAGN